MDYAKQVRDQIYKAGYEVDVDADADVHETEIREAQLALYNYILVVGEEEANTGQVRVRIRDTAEPSVVKSVESLLQHFKDETAAFH
ncbi:Threonine--tRNA ligase, mitochondrial 1 [Linum grandiflorum]